MFDAIVLAGSRNDGPLKSCSLVKDEAMIKIGGRLMVEYVVESIANCRQVRQIVIAGPENGLKQVYKDNNRVIITSSGKDAIDSLKKGIASIDDVTKRVLVVTSDIPLITPEALDDFLALGSDKEVDVYYPVVPKLIIEESFPGVERTYVKLKDGIFTGGNIFLINPEIVDCCAQKAQQIVNLRKSPLKLCRLLGIPFVVKYLLRRLSIKEIESKVSTLMNIRGAGVISPFPEVGVDVDKPSDLNLVKKVLQNKFLKTS